jgi:hypothetical protein
MSVYCFLLASAIQHDGSLLHLLQVMFQYFPDSTSLKPVLEGLQVEMLPAPPLEQAKVGGALAGCCPNLAAFSGCVVMSTRKYLPHMQCLHNNGQWSAERVPLRFCARSHLSNHRPWQLPTPTITRNPPPSLQVDVSIYIDGKGHLGMDYMAELFDPPTIQSIGDSLLRMLEGAAASPAAGIWGLPILGQANKAQLARMTSGEVRPHYVPGGGAALTVERFERVAATEPSRPCLIFNGAKLSYGEVNARANRLAHWLRAAGVGQDVAVGVMLDRSFELVIAMLAAMKVGRTWLSDPFVYRSFFQLALIVL